MANPLVNEINQEFTGSGASVVPLSSQFYNNQISIEGVTTGSATIRAKARGKSDFEDVDGGAISDLSTNQTVSILSCMLSAIEVTVADGGTYNAIVTQTNLSIGTV